MADYYLDDAIKFRNGTQVRGKYPNTLNELPLVTYAGVLYNKYLIKCFGLRSHYSSIDYVGFGFMNFDEIVLHDHLQNIGCKTPFQKTARTKTICESKEQIKRANFDLMKSRDIRKACTIPMSINFDYYETNYGQINGSDWFHIYVTFPDNYEEITMVRAVDIHSAIGNSGGYIGLFLGNETYLYLSFKSLF